MDVGALTLGLKAGDALIVAAGKLEMHITHGTQWGSNGRGRLLRSSSPIISQVRFHARDPPVRRYEPPRASRSTEVIHIALAGALTV